MATTVATSFEDQNYSSANKPSSATLKTDIAAIGTAINTHNAATTGEHGVSGTIVGTSDTQTLTNKTIDGSANTLSKLSAAWPIGSVYLAVVSTNPATLLGFGTWSQIAQGQMLIGQKTADADFDTAEETGGAKTVTLTTTELPAHTHAAGTLAADSSGAHTHTVGLATDGDQDGSGSNGAVYGSGMNTGSSGAHTHTISGSTASSGTGSAFSIMNPYFVVYAWKRTA
jgi:hypothetical protein